MRLGHFVYEEVETAGPSHTQVTNLKQSMVDCLTKHVADFGTWSQEDQLQAFERIRYWTYEIFCDLFAIRLIGPAFSFAALEFFNLLGVMSKSDCVTFSESHPAT